MSQRTDICGFCRSTDIDHEEIETVSQPFTAHLCRGCGAYNLEEAPQGSSTEEEMATGWYQNGEDRVASSPFSHYPYWNPRTRREMHFWALAGIGPIRLGSTREGASFVPPSAILRWGERP